MKGKFIISCAIFLALVNSERAVPLRAALLRTSEPTQRKLPARRVSLPHAVSFREVSGRGLIVKVWINAGGPFNFALDTGAGSTVLSERTADEANVAISNGRPLSVAGLTGTRSSARQARVESIAIGDPDNALPGRGEILVTSGLPNDLDGILDPTEAFAPFGYVIDIPRREVAAFDPQVNPLRMNIQPNDGAVVSWLREARGRRPFVQLDDGSHALLDTGSGLGLAIRDSEPPSENTNGRVRDIGGGSVSAHRVSPRTISIGSLTLRRIPTDMVSGAEADAPVLLGLSALRPFRIRFDPVHRLIEIAPS